MIKAVLLNDISQSFSALSRGRHDSLDRKGSVCCRPVGSVPCLGLHELSLVYCHQHHVSNDSFNQLTVVEISLLRLSQDVDLY